MGSERRPGSAGYQSYEGVGESCWVPWWILKLTNTLGEQAVQIFEVLRKIGHKHQFSAGLVIGGKSLKDEQERLSRMNILVATPGRLLQHMDQTLGFECDQLQMLGESLAARALGLTDPRPFPSTRRGRPHS